MVAGEMGGGEGEMKITRSHPPGSWSVCIWNPDYWCAFMEGWQPVMSGMTLCDAMQVVASRERRGWDRQVSLWVHNFTADEIFQAWKNSQPAKAKADKRSAKKAVRQKTLFGE